MRRFSVSKTVLLIICLMYLILYVDRVNISTAAPLIKADLGLSNTQLGLAFSAFAYPYALFQLIGGYIGDIFGARLTLCVSGLIVCAATAATGAVGGLASLFAARLALGIGEGATFPTATRAMAVWVPERSWGFAQGITHSSARIGNAATPPLIALLIGMVSWRGAFVVLALLSLIWVLVWLWYFRDVPATPPLTAEELATLPTRSRGTVSEPVPWLKLFRRMLPVTAVDFCYGWTLWLFLSWIPSFFYQNYQQNLMQSAFYSAGVFLAGVIGDTLGGVVSDQILRRTGDQNAARRNVIVAGGHRAETFRIRKRHDEFRLWHCRHHLALRLRLSDRSHRKLDPAIRRFDLPFAARRGPSVPDAPRPTVRDGRDPTGDRAGGRMIMSPRKRC